MVTWKNEKHFKGGGRQRGRSSQKEKSVRTKEQRPENQCMPWEYQVDWCGWSMESEKGKGRRGQEVRMEPAHRGLPMPYSIY